MPLFTHERSEPEAQMMTYDSSEDYSFDSLGNSTDSADTTPRAWIRLTIRDGYGYQKDWVKTEDENLGEAVRSYSLYSGLAEDDFTLTLRTVPINTFNAIETQPLQNGDVLLVVINPARAIPVNNPNFGYQLRQLSPKDSNGNPYPRYDGELTQPSECSLQLLLSNIWPGMPTVLIECRALRHLTIEEVRYRLQEALLLRGTPVNFTGDTNLLVAKLETLLDDDRPLQLRFARYHTTTKDPIHVTAGIKFHLGPGVKHQLDSVLFAIKEERDFPERSTASVGFCMPETSTFRTLLDWAQDHFQLHDQPFHICHGLHVIEPHEVLNEGGFIAGSYYDLALRLGPAPPWMLPQHPRAIPNPWNIFLFFRQGEDTLHRLPAHMGQTLREIIDLPHLPSSQSARVLYNGERMDLDTRISKIGVYEGCEFEIMEEQLGGAPPQRLLRYRLGIRPLSNSSPLRQSTPAPSTQPNPPTDQESSPQQNDPSSQHLDEDRMQEDTPLEGFRDLLGDQHGLIQGRCQQLPRPANNHVRISLVGPTIGTWAAILGPYTPLWTIAIYLERMHGKRFRYLHQGATLDRCTATPWGSTIEDEDQVDVFEEQVGGGPTSPPDDHTTVSTSALAHLVDFEHGFYRGPADLLPSPSPDHLRLSLHHPTWGVWSFLLASWVPLSLVAQHLSLTNDTRICLSKDGLQPVPALSSAASLTLKDGDSLQILTDEPSLSIEDFGNTLLQNLPAPTQQSLTSPALAVSNRFTALSSLPTSDPDLFQDLTGPIDLPPGYKIIPGRLIYVAPSTEDQVQLYLDGDKTGPAVVLLPRNGSLAIITNYLDSCHGEDLRYLVDGQRINPEWPISDLDLEDGCQLSAYSEQTGGGPSAHEDEQEPLDDEADGAYEDQDRFTETRFPTSPSVKTSNIPSANSTGPTTPAHIPSRARQSHLADLIPKGNNPAIPIFKGRNSKGFIRKYEALGRTRGATDDDLLDHLVFNVSDFEPDIFSLIESHESFTNRDWPAVRKFILTGFDGPEVDIFTEQDLISFVKEERTLGTLEELNHYNLAFLDISSKLLQRGKIGSQQQLHYFVTGLPISIRRELEHSELRVDEATYETVLHEVQEYFRPTTFFRRLNLEMQREQAQIQHRAPIRSPSLNLSGPSGTLGSTSNSNLTRQLEQLSLTITQAMEKASTSNSRPPPPPAQQYRPPPPTQPYRPPPPAQPTQPLTFSQQGPSTGSNAIPLDPRSQRPMLCVYCNDPNHLRRSCPILSDHIQQGHVRILDNKICFSDGSPVQGRYGYLHEAVTERIRSGRSPAPPPPTQPTINLTSNYLQFDFSTYDYDDEEEEFMSNAMSTDATKRAHETEEDQRNSRPRLTRTTGPASTPTPLVRFADPNPPTPGVTHPFNHPPVMTQVPPLTPAPSASSLPPATGQQPTPPTSPEADSDDDDSGPTLRPPKPFRRLRASKVKRESNPDEVAQSLLSSPVTLPWRVIVGLSKDVQRVILEHIRNELVPIPTTHHPVPWADPDKASVAAHLLHHLTGSAIKTPTQELSRQLIHQMNHVALSSPTPSWYTHGLPMVPVSIKGRQYIALLDSGSQINVLKSSIRDELNLPLRYDGRHVVIGAGQQKTRLDGICEATPVALASMTEPLHLWVQQRCGYDLILGMPALAAFGVKIDCISGKATMASKDNKLVELQVLSPDDPYNTLELPGSFHPSSPTTEVNEYAFHLNHYNFKFFGSGAWTKKPLTYHINTKRKSVEEKIRPVAAPPKTFISQPLRPPVYDRDPYATPLTPFPPPFEATDKLTAERVDKLNFGPPDFINAEERNLLLHVLKLRSAAIAFDSKDRRKLNPDIADPYEIQTVPHEIWTDPTYPYPKAAREEILALIDEQLAMGDLEYSDSPYSTAHFFIRKSSGTYRMIIDMRSANAISIRDANIPPYLPDYVDGFVGRVCYGLYDLMSFYDQLLLHPASRRLTAFRSPRGHVQKTGMPQGYTNGPAVAQRTADHIGGNDVPHNFVPFIDDYGAKGPSSHYDHETLPGTTIRRWVYEFAITIERLLYRLEHAHLVVSGAKMVVITDEIEITGVRVGFEGKRADPAKIDKLQAWENPCRSQSSLRGFLGIANFVRSFIPDFAIIDAPLRQLVGKRWKWTDAASAAMDQLKAAAAGHHFLGVLDYTSDDDIVLSVDSSQIAVGFVLWQDRPSGRVVILYDSIAMTETEQRYSQPKLELCGVYKAIRKMRYHLIGVRFILEVDAISLKQMLNRPDLSNPAMARWVAHLKQYDFSVRHIPGRLHIIPDGLSRTNFHNSTPADDEPSEGHLSASHILSIRSAPHSVPSSPAPDLPFNANQYSARFRLLGFWLASGGTHSSLRSLPRHERRWIRSQLAFFFLQDGRLFRRNGDGLPQLVLDDPASRLQALTYAHEHLGHRGRDAMAALLLSRVWWDSLRGDCLTHARSCSTCQLRSRSAEVETQRFAPIPRLFETFALDIVDIGANTGPRRYLVLARDLLTGWVEGRALPNKLASSVAKFIEDEILSRYGPVIRQILTDNGPENSADTTALLVRLGIRHARITPNHPQGNAIVERGHAPVVEGLLKASFDDRLRTFTYLPYILWADRITTRRTTGSSPFELVFGYTPLLPIDYDLNTFPMLAWDQVRTTGDLLASRARQLRQRDDDLERAAVLLRYARSLGRQYLDDTQAHKLRDPLAPNTMVLVRSIATFPGKSVDRWQGPYLIHDHTPSGSYHLTELDGTPLLRAYGADRLRRYFPRARTINPDRSFLDDAHDGAFDEPLAPPPPPPPVLPAVSSGEPVAVDNDLPAPSPSVADGDTTLLDEVPLPEPDVPDAHPHPFPPPPLPDPISVAPGSTS